MLHVGLTAHEYSIDFRVDMDRDGTVLEIMFARLVGVRSELFRSCLGTSPMACIRTQQAPTEGIGHFAI